MFSKHYVLLFLGLGLLFSFGNVGAVELDLNASEISPKYSVLNPDNKPNLISISLKDVHGNYVPIEEDDNILANLTCLYDNEKNLYKFVDDGCNTQCLYNCNGELPSKIQVKYGDTLLKEYLVDIPKTVINLKETVFGPHEITHLDEENITIHMPVRFFNYYGEMIEEENTIMYNNILTKVYFYDADESLVNTVSLNYFGLNDQSFVTVRTDLNAVKIKLSLSVLLGVASEIERVYELS